MHLGVLVFRLFLHVLYRLRKCPKEQGGRSAHFFICDWDSSIWINDLGTGCVHISLD